MTASAVVMMCIACVGLWGGAVMSLVIMFRSSDKDLAGVIEEIEEADASEPEAIDEE